MARRTLLGGMLSAIVLALLMSAGSTSVLATAPCDSNHGPFTSVLCLGDHIVNGQYIQSPDGNYRMWSSSGDLIITSGGGANNFYRMYVATNNQGYVAECEYVGTNHCSLNYRDIYGVNHYYGAGDTVSGFYITIGNGGCIEAYWIDGSPSGGDCS